MQLVADEAGAFTLTVELAQAQARGRLPGMPWRHCPQSKVRAMTNIISHDTALQLYKPLIRLSLECPTAADPCCRQVYRHDLDLLSLVQRRHARHLPTTLRQR